MGGVDYNKSPIVEFKTSTNGSPVVNEVPGFTRYADEKRELIHDALYDGDEIWGLSLEVFVLATCGALALALIVVGIIYNIFKHFSSKGSCGFCRHSNGSDFDEDSEDEDSESDDEDEIIEEDATAEKEPLKKVTISNSTLPEPSTATTILAMP